MVLPASGNPLSLNQLHVEAGGTSGTECSLNDSDIRDIIGVSAGSSQNIQQYYGQSATSALASSVEVATVTNTTSTNVFTFSFSGGVSDNDVIIIGNFNYAATSVHATYPSVAAPFGARATYTDTQGRFAWATGYYTELSIQSIVCGASTPNSFQWNAGGVWSTAAQAGMVAIKYSTDGTRSLNGRNYTILGTSSTLQNIGSPSNTSDNSTSIAPGVSPNSSTQDGLITVAFKGGNNANDWGFNKTGDLNSTLSLHNFNELKYYSQAQTPPSSGSYDTTNVTTGYGGTSWIYFGAAFELVR